MMMGDDCDDVTDNDDDGDVIDAAKIRRPRLAVVERQGSPSPSSASPNSLDLGLLLNHPPPLPSSHPHRDGGEGEVGQGSDLFAARRVSK